MFKIVDEYWGAWAEEIGLPRKAGTLICLLLCTLFIAPCLPAAAERQSAVASITAYIPLRQSVTIHFQTSSIPVTEADIARGYVDIAEATHMSIQNNDMEGCLLHIQGFGYPFYKAKIYGLPPEVEIDAREAFVPLRYAKNGITKVLSYRFYLADGIRAGEYSWPLTFSLRKIGDR